MRFIYMPGIDSSGYLMHYGKGHDDNPPGRGSGRYPWGSGEKNFKKLKNTRVHGILSDFGNHVRSKNNIVSQKSLFDALTTTYAPTNPDRDNSFFNTDGNHYDKIGERDMRTLNAARNNSSMNDDNNCMACSLIGELAVQGYKGIAANGSSNGNRPLDVPEYFPGATMEQVNFGYDADDFMRRTYGLGSSGVMSGFYTDNNNNVIDGHAVHWSISKNGNPYIQDVQTGITYNSFSDAQDQLSFDKSLGCVVSRLDNCKPDINKMISNGLLSHFESNTPYLYKPYNSNLETTYDAARQKSKEKLYEEYKDYKKQRLNSMGY